MNTLVTSAVGALAVRARIGSALESILRGFAAHRSVYAIAIFTFILGLAVAPISGNWPDLAIVQTFGFYLVIASIAGLLLGVVFKFFQLALIERPKSPTVAMWSWLKGCVLKGDRVSNTVHSFVPMVIFASGFGILKGAIGVLHPFSWDVSFRQLDMAVSGGRMPHEWLEWLTASPTAVYLINFNYNIWLFVILGAYFAIGMSARSTASRLRFLNAFYLLWLIGGIFVAFAFSSAGPAFYERLGLGNAYAPLMASLHEASEYFSIWALSIQDVLWDGYTGARRGSAGIAAFPSLHVGASVLLALYVTRCHPRLAIPAWLFAAGILLGSVVLAWHYVVDGYAGALLALLFWKLANSRLFGVRTDDEA